MGDSLGSRAIPATYSYNHGGIQSKSELNAHGAMLSRISVDGGDVNNDIFGIDIRLPQTAQNKMYKVTGKGTDVRILNGIWVRNTKLCATNLANDTTFAPLTEAGVASNFTGSIYVFALLSQSDGSGGDSFTPADLDPSTGTYGSGTTTIDFTNGVGVFFIAGESYVIDGITQGPGRQIYPLAELVYSEGKRTKITQLHVGPIIDADPLNNGDNVGGANHFNLEYTSLSLYNLTVSKYRWVHSAAGVINIFELVTPAVFDQGDLVDQDAIYATILPEPTGLAGGDPDPGLGGFALTIRSENAADVWRTNYDDKAMRTLFKMLCQCSGPNDYGDGTTRISIPNFNLLTNETPNTFYMRPDGTNTGIAAIDNDDPRVYGLNYMSDDTNSSEGALQDYNAFETLINSADVTNYTNEHAIMYYDYGGAGDTTKKYARVDASGLAGRSDQASIQITGNRLQLYDFTNPTPFAFTDATTESSGADGDYLFLARKRSDANGDELKYLDISGMTVASAYDLEPGTPFEHNDLSDMADTTGANMDHNYAYLRRYDTVGDATYENDAEYRNKGQIYSGTLGLADTGTGDPDVTNVWDETNFLVEVDAYISMASGTYTTIDATTDATLSSSTGDVNITASSVDVNISAEYSVNYFATYGAHSFQTGRIVVSNTSEATATTASIETEGGVTAKDGGWFIKGDIVGQAGYFSDGTYAIKVGDGTDVIDVDGVKYSPMTVDVVIGGITKTINILGSLV